MIVRLCPWAHSLISQTRLAPLPAVTISASCQKRNHKKMTASSRSRARSSRRRIVRLKFLRSKRQTTPVIEVFPLPFLLSFRFRRRQKEISSQRTSKHRLLSLRLTMCLTGMLGWISTIIRASSVIWSNSASPRRMPGLISSKTVRGKSQTRTRRTAIQSRNVWGPIRSHR